MIMPRTAFVCFVLPLLLLLSNSSGNTPQVPGKKSGETGILEKMIVANGNVSMDLDLKRLNGGGAGRADSNFDTLRFQIGPNSFFTVLVFNDELRGPDAGSMALIPGNTANLPTALQAALSQLVIEKLPSDAAFDLA